LATEHRRARRGPPSRVASRARSPAPRRSCSRAARTIRSSRSRTGSRQRCDAGSCARRSGLLVQVA